MPPSSKGYVRDYKAEYKKSQASKKAKTDRAARNKVRRAAIKKGTVKKGDSSKDIDHKKPLRNGGSKKKSNTRVRSTSTNRSANGHRKGEKQNRSKK